MSILSGGMKRVFTPARAYQFLGVKQRGILNQLVLFLSAHRMLSIYNTMNPNKAPLLVYIPVNKNSVTRDNIKYSGSAIRNNTRFIAIISISMNIYLFIHSFN